MPITQEHAQELHSRVQGRIAGLRELVEKRYGVDIPCSVKYDLKGYTAGRAYPSQNVIRLNGHHLVNNVDDFIHNTVGHEYAHIVQYKLYPRCKPHGWEWRSVMRVFGLEPTRCHTYESKPARQRQRKPKVRVHCGCPDGQLMGQTQYRRLRMGTRYRCRKCSCTIHL